MKEDSQVEIYARAFKALRYSYHSTFFKKVEYYERQAYNSFPVNGLGSLFADIWSLCKERMSKEDELNHSDSVEDINAYELAKWYMNLDNIDKISFLLSVHSVLSTEAYSDIKRGRVKLGAMLVMAMDKVSQKISGLHKIIHNRA